MGKSNASAKKLQEVILAKTTESLNEEKTTKKSNKAATKKATTSEEAIIVKPLKEKKTKKVTPAKEEKTAPKEKGTKKAIEKKPKELKYIYPEDCKDSLAKKKFRAETRAKVRHYNKELSGLKEGSKEYKATMAKFTAFKKERGLLRA